MITRGFPSRLLLLCASEEECSEWYVNGLKEAQRVGARKREGWGWWMMNGMGDEGSVYSVQ